MKCPSCSSRTRVVETRSAPGGLALRRRRECLGCGRRFTTFERFDHGPMYVVKRDGERQPFHREKLRRALVGATHKRSVRAPQLDPIVDRIEAELSAAGGELPAQRIGELVLDELRGLDYGAYLQFAGTLPSVNAEIADSPPTGSVRSTREAP